MKRLGLILAGSLVALTGCLKDHTTRSQLDDDVDKPTVRTIGDVAEFQTAGAVPVSGVGLVVGLEGTGGGAPPGPYRQMMEEQLKRCKIDNPKAWLDSNDTALVFVSARILAGSRAGERADVEITLPPGSKVKSLRGGYLLETPLSTYASQGQVRAYLEQNDIKPVGGGDGLLKGHVMADAEGPLHVAPNDKENKAEVRANADMPEDGVRRAFVWKGAKSKINQPFFMVLNPDQQRYRMAGVVAERINETFHGPGAVDKIAKQRNADSVVLTIPPQYRNNATHFFRVVRMIPTERVDENSEYRRRLESELQEPETTLTASLRLEALGRGSIPVLRDAMKTSKYPLVQFAAAEALAYLGEPISANALASLAEKHASLQAYCLTALTSLDEAASSFALQELLTSEAPEIRYGAFKALREREPREYAGIQLNKSFWLHCAAPESQSLVHVLNSGRAEIVVFGKTPRLVAPFSLRAGPDLVVTARAGDSAVTISRFSTRKSQRQEQCSFAVADVIKALADLGAQYADVVELLTLARDLKAIDCELAMDALPKGVEIKRLAEHARGDKMMEREADLMRDPAEKPKVNVFETVPR
jgi:flagellar basal body P-ring protein FlgI